MCQPLPPPPLQHKRKDTGTGGRLKLCRGEATKTKLTTLCPYVLQSMDIEIVGVGDTKFYPKGVH